MEGGYCFKIVSGLRFAGTGRHEPIKRGVALNVQLHNAPAKTARGVTELVARLKKPAPTLGLKCCGL